MSRSGADADGMVLITGASGVVGTALLEQLTDLPAAALVHTTPVGDVGLELVVGDVTAPQLGLGHQRHAELASRTRAIVHCAANTDFGSPPGEITVLNVDGTQRMLELAAATDGAPLYYVSTAFVARAGLLPRGREGSWGCADGRDEYLASKQQAERLVRDSGLPTVIIRPSVLGADSATGAIARHQGLHLLVGALCRNALPFVPFTADTLIDFVPQDVVARAIAALVRGHVTAGEYWVTAGPSALTAQAIVDVGTAQMRAAGHEIAAPRFLPTEMVERLILPAFLDCFPQRQQRLFENFIALATLFSTPIPFPTSIPDLDGGPGLPTTDQLAEALARSVRRDFVRTPNVAQVAR